MVSPLRRIGRITAKALRVLVVLLVVVLSALLLVIVLAETGWGKNRLRGLIVSQANRYLTATLTIGRLEGSLFGGIRLGDIDLSRDGRTLIHVDEAALVYNIRELVAAGVTIRSVKLTRPVIVGSKLPDGRWDLGALVKREAREQERTGPKRPIEVQSIEIADGHISLTSPLDFGAAHVPTDFQKLDASFKFVYVPVRWTLTFDRLSWIGHAPDLTVNQIRGAMGRGPGGWFFDNFSVTTPRSAYVLGGRIDNSKKPTEIDLQVRAARFAFQEWSGILRGLKNIAVESSFDTSLKGPVNRLATTIRLDGSGGSVKGALTLDTTVPGWHGAGAVDVGTLNLARWLNREDRPSDITGHVTFDLALELGKHFPRGVYTFAGPHAMYMNYAADDMKARGQITDKQVLIASMTGRAYGANVSADEGSIGIDDPYPYHFRGVVDGIDLRQLPKEVPVPHVESRLTMDYDVNGRFSRPVITASATFAPSEFLGAKIGAGTIGSIDTAQQPIRYTGDGPIENVDLGRFGRGLDVLWLQEPRYAGTLSGRFRMEGSGSSAAALTLTGGGRLARADLFKGTLTDADVTIDIANGTLKASYDGSFAKIDPAIPFQEPRVAASLTGSGRMTATVNELMLRETTLADYDVRGTMALQNSTLRDLHIDRGSIDAALAASTLTVTKLETEGPELAGNAAGTVALTDTANSNLTYDVTRVDLSRVEPWTGEKMAGTLSTKGTLTGPYTALRFAGDATISRLDAFDINALSLEGHYDATLPSGDLRGLAGRADARASFVNMFGQSAEQATGVVTFDGDRIGFDLTADRKDGPGGALKGQITLDTEHQRASVHEMTASLGGTTWKLTAQTIPPTVGWTDDSITVSPAQLTEEGGEGRVDVSGTWRTDGAGTLQIAARRVFLDNLQRAFQQRVRYGGVLDADLTVRGTRERPQVGGTITVTNGRVERVSYEKLAGTFNYTDRAFTIDMRLDQAPGVWVTAVGSAPASLFARDGPDERVDLAVKSSGIDLGLLAGVTDVIRDVSGSLLVDAKVVGTSRDPHFDGTVTIGNAAFQVVDSGSKYKNGSLKLALAPERMTVETFHLEDANGQPLDITGSLGTHELRVSDLEMDIVAKKFEMMRNEFGRVDIDATLRVRGQFEKPVLTGEMTITSGALRIDEILSRTLVQPYATKPAEAPEVDAVAALNPWDRLAFNVTLHVPNTLRMSGENVQIAANTPLGLGDFNLRVAGDLYLTKDAATADAPVAPLYVNGWFDSVSGTYAFQGRRFDVREGSSINFRGDLNPELYVTVTREISGVQTRVTLTGPLQGPELLLASAPPLDPSDILSLIVFNTSTNQLSGLQQQELLVRAGALAAGFIATPLVSAIEGKVGIDILEIEPASDIAGAFRVTVGDEIAPGLVARFSRQFGQDPYDEATIEYSLSRILRIRATFSDAQSLSARSPFRRTERAGIDLLFFFSF